jgi:hypothetical protein
MPRRCGPTTERALTEPTRLLGSCPDRARVSIPSAASPSRRRHPSGVELVRQESPARRYGEVSEASRPTRDSAHREWRWGPDLVRLFGAARLDRPDTAGVNHPGAATDAVPRRDRIEIQHQTSFVTTPQNRCFHSSGGGHKTVSWPQRSAKKCINRPCASNCKVEGGRRPSKGNAMATGRRSEVLLLRRMVRPGM